METAIKSVVAIFILQLSFCSALECYFCGIVDGRPDWSNPDCPSTQYLTTVPEGSLPSGLAVSRVPQVQNVTSAVPKRLEPALPGVSQEHDVDATVYKYCVVGTGVGYGEAFGYTFLTRGYLISPLSNLSGTCGRGDTTNGFPARFCYCSTDKCNGASHTSAYASGLLGWIAIVTILIRSASGI